MKRKIISVIMLSALVLNGCKNTVIQDSAQGSETDNYSIFTQPATPDEVTIEIVNATECSNEVYYKSLKCSLEGGEGITTTEDQMEYIISYAKDIKEPDYVEYMSHNDMRYKEEFEKHNYLGRISVTYCTETATGAKRYNCEWKRLFDEFPDGYEDFIKLINDLDSGDDIILGEPMVMSPELFTRITGITDDMVTDGTVEEVLNKYNFRVDQIIEQYPYGFAESYVNSEVTVSQLIEYWPLFRSLPTEIRNEQSTEEEFQAYAEEVAKAMGLDPSVVDDYKYGITKVGGKLVDGNTGEKYKTFDSVIVYQTCDIPEEYEYSDTLPYHLVSHTYLDGGDFDQDVRRTIFYSPDGKFAVVVFGCLERSYGSDWIQPAELYEFYLKIADLVE